MKLSNSFTESISAILKDDSSTFFKALQAPSPASIRFNPYKISQKPEGENIPWSRYGYYLDQRQTFTLDPMFHAGCYYVQEASSMFIEHIYREVLGERSGLKILDLCAAPGGKTTLLSTLAGLENTIVANEVIRSRANILAGNVRKWGLGNVVVTNNDPSHFTDFKDYFDVILVDAPCSGEGMFRKNPDAVDEWSPEAVELCSQRQKRILSDIMPTLKPSGVLIYSTCTFNTKENEENIEWIARNFDVDAVPIDIPSDWGITETSVSNSDSDDIRCYRFYPHKVSGEGFFCSVIMKQDGKTRTKVPKSRKNIMTDAPKPTSKILSEWVNQPEFMRFSAIGPNYYGFYENSYKVVELLSQTLTPIYSGVIMGQIFSSKLKPDHSLAMFHDLDRSKVACSALSYEEALNYLRKNDPNSESFSEGINLVTYDNFALGWAKRIGNRCNNLYPKEQRIMNL